MAIGQFEFDKYINQEDIKPLIQKQLLEPLLASTQEDSFFMRKGMYKGRMNSKSASIPVLDSVIEPHWVEGDEPCLTGNTALFPDGDFHVGIKKPTTFGFDQKHFNAVKCAAIVVIPECDLEDALDGGSFDLLAEVRRQARSQFPCHFDQTVAFGIRDFVRGQIRKPKGAPDPLFIGAAAAGQVKALGDDPDLKELLFADDGLITSLECNGFSADCIVMSPKMKSCLRTYCDSCDMSNVDITPTEIEGTQIEMPKNLTPRGATNAKWMLAFDSSTFHWMDRSDLNFKILTEATIEDPNTGQKINLAQQNAIGIRMDMRLAWQIVVPWDKLREDGNNAFPAAWLSDTDFSTLG